MILEYKLKEQDFLEFQLFTASKSERINKKKRKGWIMLTLSSIVVACFFFLNENMTMTIYFGVVAIATVLFYPTYFKWRYKKHYKGYIRENYSKRFGELQTLEINEHSLISKDKISEGKINLKEIEQIDETANHFFLKISTGMTLLIPKEEISGLDRLRGQFKELGFTINDEVNWKWK